MEYADALALHARCEKLIRDHPENGSEADREIRGFVPCGIYEHFKSSPQGRKYYAVIGVCRKVNRQSEGFDPYEYHVPYASLYPPHTFVPDTRELVGPDGFLMPIDRPGYRGVRFRMIRGASEEELFRVARSYLTR